MAARTGGDNLEAVPELNPAKQTLTESERAHRQSNRQEFARQSGTFERDGSIFRDEDILGWIGAHLPLEEIATDELTVLDVAGGTGQLGRFLVRRGGFAVIVDLTPEMLSEGARAAREREERGVVFLEGDATHLPFADEQFDLVVSRFALHHIDDPAKAAREMARVCRPGGAVAIIDMVSEPEEPGRLHNRLERLRDPSHRMALQEHELVQVLRDAGLDAAIVGERRQQIVALPWLERAEPGEHEHVHVVEALQEELNGGAATGLGASLGEDQALSIEHRWLIACGRRT